MDESEPRSPPYKSEEADPTSIASCPSGKKESRLEMQKKIVRTISDLAKVKGELEQAKQKHAVELEGVRTEAANSRRALASYKHHLGDPRVETVHNVASVADPGRRIPVGVSGVIAHRSLLDKLADNLRPGIAANRPKTAMARHHNTPWKEQPSIAASSSNSNSKQKSAKQGGIKLSARPQSAFVHKLNHSVKMSKQ